MPVMTRTPGGEEIVILSRPEYDRLVAQREDADDIRAADRIVARVAAGAEELLTDAEVSELLKAESPLAFWRKKRDLTQAALAETKGDIKTLQKIADALSITLDDLIQE